MTISASAGGVPAATNSARPISVRRSAAIFGILPSSSISRAELGGVDPYSVKALRIVEEDLLLEAVRDVPAIGQSRYRVRELAIPMRVIRREQDIVGRKEVRHVAQGLFFRLAGYEDSAAGHVFRRLRLQQRRVELAELVFFVHVLHPEGDPADPGFEERDAQILILLQKTAVDDRGASDQLL